MAEPPKEPKKKKKVEIEYDIDPTLPEEEQRRLRKQIRAERRKEREERRRRREGAGGGSAPAGEEPKAPKKSPRASGVKSPRTSVKAVVTDVSKEELVPKKGSAAWEWAQKQKEEEEKKNREASREAELSELKEARGDDAAAARALAKEKEREALEAKQREEDLKKRQEDLDLEEQKEKRRQERLRREQKAKDEEERLKDEEARAMKAKLDAAKAEREARELEIREAKLKEEAAKRRAEEAARRKEEEEARKRREEVLAKRREEERKEREKREAERKAKAAQERAEYEARRKAQMEKFMAEQEESARERLLNMSEREREEAVRAEEERWKAADRRERTRQVWAERLRDAEEKVRQEYREKFDKLQAVEDVVNARKASYAGNETEEWFYNPVPSRVFSAQGALSDLGAQMSVHLDAPTWVVVGAKSRAKSNVVDALLGMPVFKGIDVVRPFEISLKFDVDAETTPVAVFEDNVRTQLDAFKIPSEIASRNIADEKELCKLTLRYKFFWDLKIIVTPDLPEPILPAVYDPQTWEEKVMKQIVPVNRMILWVDRCDGEQPFGSQFARMMAIADAKHARSLLVLNGLSEVLTELTLTSEVNELIGQSHPLPVYFVSYSKEKNVAEDVVAKNDADIEALKRLKSFGAFDARVGIKRLAKHIQRISHQIYQRNLDPLILSQINHNSAKLNLQLTNVESKIASIEPSELRGFASKYLMEYLQNFRQALNGVGGDPFMNGETLAEEREAVGMTGSRWTINPRTHVPVDTANVVNAGEKLLGRGAFVRLLADMEAAVKKAPLETADKAFFANTGPARSGLGSDFMYAASDTASVRASQMLRPILLTAVERAAHIARNLTGAAEWGVTQRRGAEGNHAISRAPFFYATVRDIVLDFVDIQTKKCCAALDDEIRATAFLPMPLLKTKAPKQEEQEMKELESMTGSAVNMLRERLLESGKLILFENMFNPLTSEIQNFVQSRMALVRAEEIESSLEPDIARAKLMEVKCRLEQEASLSQEYLRIFNLNVKDFAY